jgi:hypothetical protein
MQLASISRAGSRSTNGQNRTGLVRSQFCEGAFAHGAVASAQKQPPEMKAAASGRNVSRPNSYLAPCGAGGLAEGVVVLLPEASEPDVPAEEPSELSLPAVPAAPG